MVGDAIKDAYFSLEDKWFALTEKIPGVSSAVDSLENKGVPTFPAFIALIILIIVVLAFTFALTSGAPLSLTIKDQDGNPIVGATVTVFFNGDEVSFLSTNSNGEANFILAPEDYDVKVEKNGYGTITATISTGEKEELTLTLDDVSITKAVSLKTASGQTISGNGTLNYSCAGSNAIYTALYTNGKFNADFSNCQNIEIVSVSGHTVVQGSVSFSGVENVIVGDQTDNVGTVTVVLTATDLSDGLKIDLMGEDGIPQKTAINTGTTVVFNDVSTKKYYIVVTDSLGAYKPYDGKALGEIKELTKNGQITFNATLEKSTNSAINITIKDTLGLPISGAMVKLELATTLTSVETLTTGMTGTANFNVAAGETYVISAEHPNYLVTGGESISAGESKVITLVEATQENSRTITVITKDPTNDPVNNVRITLKTMDGTIVGEKNTGADGKAFFYNLEIGSYYAYAIKDGFDGVTSTRITLLPREANELPITMDIGKGTIKLNVINNQREALRGVNITAINYFDGTDEGVSSTNEEGIATFDIRADKKVYFEIELSGHMDYFTTSIYPDEGSTIDKEIVLVASSGKMSLTMIGLYSGDTVVSNSDREVSQGTYTAKLLLEVPKGSFSEAGVHVRTGNASNNTTNLMEEDPAYIGEVYTSAKKIIKGTTYTPPDGYNVDSQNYTNGNAKWIESIFKNPKEGVYEVEVDVTVTEINPNVGIDLWYRAWAKGSSLLKDPQSNIGGHELYLGAKNYLLSSGAANLCGDTFCKSYSVQTISGNNTGKIQYITNQMSAKQDTSYVLMANLINYSGKALNSSVLDIDGSGITIDGITVNGVEYDEDDEIILGTLSVDSFTQVSIAFSTTQSGSGSINLLVNSATKTELEETIAINVKANKTFKLDIIPKEIIPYVTNSLFFEANDGNTPLSNVSIEIKSDNDILETLRTNSQGMATYDLSPPSAGDVITFTAQKEGYDEVVFEKDVDEKIILLVPTEIDETIKIGEVASITQKILIENATVESLKITDISVEGEVADYLEITIDDIVGEIISADSDLNFNIKLKPNQTAKKLAAPKTVEGEVEIDVEVVSAGQEFEQELPIKIRLSMPGYLDSDNCLSITPGEVTFTTSTTEVSETLTLKNNCAAEGIDVALHNVEAKINESSKFGTIFLSGSGFNSISLSDGFVELAEYLASNEEEELTLRFVPTSSASSGTQKLTLSVEGKNVPEEGEEEKVRAKVNVDLTMSDLSECIEIEEPSGGMTLDIAGWNLGYNRIVNSNMSSYAQGYQGFNRGRMPYGMQSSIPFMNQGSGSTAYEENSFTIKNNCALDVEIDLDPDSKLNVSEEEFEISAGDDETITVTPGYTLGSYNIKINAKVADSEEAEERIDTVSVQVRRLGDVDDDCIKISTSTLEFNSLIYESKKYKVYNYCYSSGLQLTRGANAVTVQCDAQTSRVNPTQSAPYFQTGQQYQGLYQTGYPTTGGFGNNYQSYLGGQSCSGNSCSMVSGTRVYSRTVSDDSSTETLIFEVMPNAQYIPQRKLFDARTQSYGLFNSIANIRDWATQTDARTRVYGRINVEYSNQYGSTQCKQFPVEIEDMWRIGESIDSLVNWGDTSASPGECVSQNQRTNSLNVKEYWKGKGGSNPHGAIPGTEYNEDNYTYIASPPAVTYGPASNTSFYPQSSYYQMLNKNDPKRASSKSKNCGYLDKLSDISHAASVGGVGIKVGTVGVGSHQRETKGANLAVTLNRSGMTDACVLISIPIKAKLSRAATFENEEITWMLTALVLRDKITPDMIKDIDKDCKKVGDTTLIDCQKKLDDLAKKYKDNKHAVNDITKELKAAGCNDFSSTAIQKAIDNAKTDTGKCEVSAETFGFNRIDEINAKEITKEEYGDYCEDKFCNNDMLHYYLERQYLELDSAIDVAKSGAVTGFCTGNTKKEVNSRKISELYKEANTDIIKSCTNTGLEFYTGTDNELVVLPYAISEEVLSDNEGEVKVIKEDPSTSDIIALNWMVDVLSDIETEEETSADELMIMVNKVNLETSTFKEDDAKALGMSKVEDNYYLPLSTYKEMNKEIYALGDTDACDTGGNCVVTFCGSEKTITPDTMKAISEKGALVRGVIEDKADEKDIRAIYNANPKLEKIFEIAKENKDVYITGIKAFDKPAEEFHKTFKATHTSEFFTGNDATTTLEPGKYDYNLDTTYCKEDRTMEVTLVRLEMDEKENKASDNVLLQEGFKVGEDTSLQYSTNAVIVEADIGGGAIFYKRTPVQVTVTTSGGAKAIVYNPTEPLTTSDHLITWNGSMTDTKLSGNTFSQTIPVSLQEQTFNGIYYYPNAGSLSIMLNQGNGSVSAKALILSNKTSALESMDNGKHAKVSIGTLTGPTLKNVIEWTKEQKVACISADGQTINWNEAELVK
ncbi:MAG: carboxypeptidase regulatory-like domain-containing protein [Candidatus Diapherotrites archaeon]|nr:carboxypeptidase regulatory-like domain-containing protein [Candidatus Diapherotrites archaeon]